MSLPLIPQLKYTYFSNFSGSPCESPSSFVGPTKNMADNSTTEMVTNGVHNEANSDGVINDVTNNDSDEDDDGDEDCLVMNADGELVNSRSQMTRL
ncbi:hypothetical protein ACF0H5_001835 [Mactra antiquata]